MPNSGAHKWTARGVVYLLHFAKPYYHARHYAGFAVDLRRRLAAHRKGQGSSLTAAVVDANIDFIVVRTWDNVTRLFERRLHRTRHLTQMCPICTKRWLRPMYPRMDANGIPH